MARAYAEAEKKYSESGAVDFNCDLCDDEIDCSECPASEPTEEIPEIEEFLQYIFTLDSQKNAGFWFPETLGIIEMQALQDLQSVKHEIEWERSKRHGQ